MYLSCPLRPKYSIGYRDGKILLSNQNQKKGWVMLKVRFNWIYELSTKSSFTFLWIIILPHWRKLKKSCMQTFKHVLQTIAAIFTKRHRSTDHRSLGACLGLHWNPDGFLPHPPLVSQNSCRSHGILRLSPCAGMTRREMQGKCFIFREGFHWPFFFTRLLFSSYHFFFHPSPFFTWPPFSPGPANNRGRMQARAKIWNLKARLLGKK